MTPSAFGRAAAYALSLLALTACGGTSPDTATPLGVPTAVPSRPIAPALPLGATAVPTAPPAAIPTAVPSPIPAVDPTAAPASAQPATIQAPVRFAVMPDRSKATFRVREQLARLQFPSDAVGSTSKVTGAIVIAPDGTFDQSQSKVNVNVNDLRTDDQLRDGFIKRTTLETQRYPNAEFVPLRASGLPVPVPGSGEYSFQLIGLTTIHGVRKELTWDVNAKRADRELTGTATTTFKFGDFGMQRPQAAVVLSIVDEIRLEIQLVATQAG